MKMKIGEDIADEQIQDRRLMRVIQLRDLNSLQPLIDHPQSAQAINAANEEEAQNLKLFGIAEPNLTNVETGTNANPDAGKTATTAILAAKSADALTQFELDSLHCIYANRGRRSCGCCNKMRRKILMMSRANFTPRSKPWANDTGTA